MSDYERKGKKYSKITYKKRMLLIDLIVNKGASITETSKKLHVKLPTAKAILSSYRKKNHVFQRKIEQGPQDNYQVIDERTPKGTTIQNEFYENSEKAEYVPGQIQSQQVPMMMFDSYLFQLMNWQMNGWPWVNGQYNFFLC